MLGGRYSDNDKISYLLGYDSEIEDSVLKWRNRRRKRSGYKD